MPKPAANPSQALIRAATVLRDTVEDLTFSAPVAYVYSPLTYAWAPHETYLRRYGNSPKRVIFLGMNPGPFGMVQTGVPFGEVAAARDWLKVQAPVETPKLQHPRRPVEGFNCPRSEVSGRRLWGLFSERFGTPERFFARHMVMNYCPLAFLEESGANRTPDKLPVSERTALFAACDTHLRAVVAALQPEWIIGVGDFALKRAHEIFGDAPLRLGRVLHPSPASPAANRGWAALATRQLEEQGVWDAKAPKSA